MIRVPHRRLSYYYLGRVTRGHLSAYILIPCDYKSIAMIHAIKITECQVRKCLSRWPQTA